MKLNILTITSLLSILANAVPVQLDGKSRLESPVVFMTLLKY